jgi:TonB family protein
LPARKRPLKFCVRLRRMFRESSRIAGSTQMPLGATPRGSTSFVRALRMKILGRRALAWIVIFTAFNASCTTTTTVRHQEAPHESPATQRTIPRLDPNHLPHIGNAYYPMESRSIPEEGICKMGITVEPDGSVSESHLVETSGFLRLDAACINAFPADVRFIPATKGGIPVEATVTIPIVWCLGVNCVERLR